VASSFFVNRLLTSNQDSLTLLSADSGSAFYMSPRISASGLTKATVSVDLKIDEYRKIIETPTGDARAPILALRLSSDGTGSMDSSYTFIISRNFVSLVVRGTPAGQVFKSDEQQTAILSNCGAGAGKFVFTPASNASLCLCKDLES
jgi:hypothetical protein